MNYNNLFTIARFSPHSLLPPDGWVGHLPFAAWIVGALAPQTFVELGTHSANSYFSFCQGVKKFQLPTKCYAVDSWQGDEHAGFYDDTVFRQVEKHNQLNYAEFSTLLRMTFDEAVARFDDTSINLLHIDGMHTYEAVRHDFETWLPKLTPGAVVLFHDIVVKVRGFGVWKFWEELQEKYEQTFHFDHSNGLGVLQLPGGPEERRLSWLTKTEGEDRNSLACYFSALGDWQMERYSFAEERKKNAADLENTKVEYQKQNAADLEKTKAEYQKQIHALHQGIDVLQQGVDDRDLWVESRNALIADRDGQINVFDHIVADQENTITILREALADRDSRLGEAHRAIAYHQEDTARLQRELAASTLRYQTTEGSAAWKITAPLRFLLDRCPALTRTVKGGLKLLWWTLSGQLTNRLRHRQARLAALVIPPASVTEREENPGEQAATLSSDSSIAGLEQTAPESFQPSLVPPKVIARPGELNYSVAVPFAHGYVKQPSPPPQLAVVCHMFYAELAGEIRRYLGNITFPITLFVSTDTAEKKSSIEQSFQGWEGGQLEVRLVPNHGRDIAPKLICFRDVYDKFEYILFLHTKQSDNATVLTAWRQFLFENLLGSQEIVQSVFTAFTHFPNLGIIASQHFEPVRIWIDWGGNFPIAKQLTERMGIVLSPETVLDFPSGSMFWARSKALRPLLDLHLSFSDFGEESGRIDGTLAHAIERLFFHVCEYAGFHWMKIAHPPMFEHTPVILPVSSDYALDQFIGCHTLRLTASWTPPPGMLSPKPIFAPAKYLVSKIQAAELGENLAIPPGLQVVIGIVTYNSEPQALKQLLSSAETALCIAEVPATNALLLIDNGEPTDLGVYAEHNVQRLSSQGNIGFGKAHNLLMEQAFKAGADIYIAANPDGAFAPKAITALIRMILVNQGRILVEALQFPVEHQKVYNPCTFDTPWASGACLAIPRVVYEKIGGFDECFFMYCEDVDISWRARAAGFLVKTCPTALFLHAVTNRSQSSEMRARMFTAGVLLAKKWGGEDFAAWAVELLAAEGHDAPLDFPVSVPPSWRQHADFKNEFSFAEARW